MMDQKFLISPTRLICAPERKATGGASLQTASDGEFEGYASLFNIADLGDDIVMPGAFKHSLLKRGARGVKMLWQHNAAEPIGAWRFMEEDSTGLKVRGKLNFAVARAREVHSLMRDGSVDGLSIGFRAEKAFRDRATGLRRLERIDLWEVSVVTFPMLPQARVSAVKRGFITHGGASSHAQSPALAVRRALLAAAEILQ